MVKLFFKIKIAFLNTEETCFQHGEYVECNNKHYELISYIQNANDKMMLLKTQKEKKKLNFKRVRVSFGGSDGKESV